MHDLNEKKLPFKPDDYVVDSSLCKNSCIGCFSCWIKHPKECCYDDEYSNLVDKLKEADEFIIISKNRYGCYSSSIKRVLERCIGYVLPYFCIRDGMIHHAPRYDHNLLLHTIFYGELTDLDKDNLYTLTKANSINLNTNFKVSYCQNIKEIKKCIS